MFCLILNFNQFDCQSPPLNIVFLFHTPLAPPATIKQKETTMDRSEEEMKFVGFFGIFKQSFKTIFSLKKIFTQITLTLILPLTIVFFAHMVISHLLFRKIESNDKASIKDWLYYWLFKIIYFTFLTVFSLLSTAAVVFTIASVYAGREVVYKKVMKVVPKVWKRLFITFVVIYLALFFYNIIGGGLIVLCGSVLGFSILGSILLLIILIVYLFGFLYLSVVWQLASVVTVLENFHGLKAMKKGKDLVKGKKKLGMGIAFVLYVILLGVVTVYELFVEHGDDNFNWAMVWRVMMGILCGLLLMIWFLLFFVTQTVLYLVCKSHHREAIDKLSLSTFLGAYTEETVVYPNVGEEIQLGRPQTPQV